MIKYILILLIVAIPCIALNSPEINLIDYENKKFINVNSTLPMQTHTYELKPVRNWIGLPIGNTFVDADEMIKDIQPACNKVASWNSSSGALETYSKIMPGRYAGTNFKIKPLEGYEIDVNSDTNWTIKYYSPIKPTLNYHILNYNSYVGIDIIRPNRCIYDD